MMIHASPPTKVTRLMLEVAALAVNFPRQAGSSTAAAPPRHDILNYYAASAGQTLVLGPPQINIEDKTFSECSRF